MKTKIWTVGISVPNIDSKANLPNPLIAKTDSVITEPPNLWPNWTAKTLTTGNTAFRLGIAKALVPFVFVYSPSLLLVAQGFNFYDFFVTLISAMIGIGLIGIGFTGYLFKRVSTFQRWYLGIISLLFIAPGLSSSIIGLVLVLPIFILQLRK